MVDGKQGSARPDETGRPASSADLTWLFNGGPQVRDVIRERLERFPEYAVWLRGLRSDVLGAVEGDA